MQAAAALRSIAHYELGSVLGQGGMGVVYLGHDTRLSRPVAIKVLTADRLDPVSRQNFRTEALLLSSLNHPNIATVHDFGTHHGVDYLVMEFVPGKTVHELLESAPLPGRQVARLGAQLMRGLAAAHAAGVIHRDIKPRNLCVTPDGLLKILDFGVATSPLAWPSSKTTESGSRFRPSLAGTLKYMAPERVAGSPADNRADIFSAGMVIYEMACGRLRFSDAHPVRQMAAILTRKLLRPRQKVPTVSRALERVILKALETDPSRRYQSARALADDLEMLSLPSAMSFINRLAASLFL